MNDSAFAVATCVCGREIRGTAQPGSGSKQAWVHTEPVRPPRYGQPHTPRPNEKVGGFQASIGSHVSWCGSEKEMPTGTPGVVVGIHPAGGGHGGEVFNVRFDIGGDPPEVAFVLCFPHEVCGRAQETA